MMDIKQYEKGEHDVLASIIMCLDNSEVDWFLSSRRVVKLRMIVHYLLMATFGSSSDESSRCLILGQRGHFRLLMHIKETQKSWGKTLFWFEITRVQNWYFSRRNASLSKSRSCEIEDHFFYINTTFYQHHFFQGWPFRDILLFWVFWYIWLLVHAIIYYASLYSTWYECKNIFYY